MNEDYTYFDFESRGRRKKMDEHQCALNHYDKRHCLTINQTCSAYIIEQGLQRVRIRYDNITGDVCLVFNKEIGTPVGVTGKESQNSIISNMGFVAKIIELLNIVTDNRRVVLHLGNNTSKNKSCACYRIYK